MKQERRKQRTENVEGALVYQLQACARRAGLRAMVVGDHDGFLVASDSGKNDDSEEIAALLPIYHKQRGNDEEMTIQTFDVLGFTLYMGAQGRKNAAVEREVQYAIAGVQRILD